MSSRVMDVDDIRTAVARFCDEFCTREEDAALLTLLEETLDKVAAFDRLEAALKRGHSVYLNGKMIDVSGEISEHETLLESLQAVPE